MKTSADGSVSAAVGSHTFEKLSGVYLYDGDWYSGGKHISVKIFAP
jgi:hypothetical protein